MTTTQTAKLAGVSRQAILQAIQEGRLPARTVDGKYEIDPDDAQTYIERRAA
jgi:excisionase family DNA binding protein